MARYGAREFRCRHEAGHAHTILLHSDRGPDSRICGGDKIERLGIEPQPDLALYWLCQRSRLAFCH